MPAAVALVLLAGGCAAAPAGIEALPAAQLDLPACTAVPPQVDADVSGLVLPAGARVTSVTPQPPLTTVTASVPRTPLEVRAELERRRDLDVLHVEDEVFEAEALLSDGAHRTYLRARAACATGSTVLAVVAPEAEASALPVPGAQGPLEMAARRAPRLRPDQSLAPYFTRRGRFAAHDPAHGRPLPGIAEMLGGLAWAAFVGGTLWRARRAARLAPADPG